MAYKTIEGRGKPIYNPKLFQQQKNECTCRRSEQYDLDGETQRQSICDIEGIYKYDFYGCRVIEIFLSRDVCV